jgi:methylenetetrahydrofolate reductase (NADPH)
MSAGHPAAPARASHRAAATRYEVLPFERAATQAAQLEEPQQLTLTSSPKHGVDHSLEFALKLRSLGHSVTPHITARGVRDPTHLSELLERVAKGEMTDVFVIGGDTAEPVGLYESAGDLLEVIAEHPMRPSSIGIAAYPEGHPLITPAELNGALDRKTRWADYMVTQLCFDPKTLRTWLEGVRARGVDLPLFIGAVGPIERRRLMEISMRIGVGPSLRFVRKQRGLARLFNSSSSSAASFYQSASELLADSELNVVGFHFFTFNELIKTIHWQRDQKQHSRSGTRWPS